MIVNISKAKTQLSQLVNLAYQGEEVIIAKNNLPLVELVIHKPKSKIVFGLLADKAVDTLDDEIEHVDEELESLFYDGEIAPQ